MKVSNDTEKAKGPTVCYVRFPDPCLYIFQFDFISDILCPFSLDEHLSFGKCRETLGRII